MDSVYVCRVRRRHGVTYFTSTFTTDEKPVIFQTGVCQYQHITLPFLAPPSLCYATFFFWLPSYTTLPSEI